ncbi:MAG: hypothetical protein IT237_01000 [Bacteroidia bacterium]|nr:hypothetical protein [Bacteroidia bacterium]
MRQSLLWKSIYLIVFVGLITSSIIYAAGLSNSPEYYKWKKIKCIKKVKTKGYACTVNGKKVKYYWEAIYVPYCGPSFNGGKKFDTCNCDCGN